VAGRHQVVEGGGRQDAVVAHGGRSAQASEERPAAGAGQVQFAWGRPASRSSQGRSVHS
jgi:hypothetical protein